MAEPINPEQVQFQPQPVDEVAVRRQSVLSGMWAGIKRGALWGGIGGLVATGAGTAISLAVGKGALGMGTGLIGMVPGAGWLAAAIGGAGALEVANGGANIRAGIMAAAGSFLGVAVPVVLGTLAIGATIGAIWGGISGYMQSDDKIEQAQQKAVQVAKQKNIERQQALTEVQKLHALEGQMDKQTEELYAQQVGQFSSPSTPPIPQGQGPLVGGRINE